MKVVIHSVKEDNKGEVPYMAIELENALISSESVSGHGGAASGRPMESLSLNFTKITYSTTPVAPATSAKDVRDRASWDMAVGKGGGARPSAGGSPAAADRRRFRPARSKGASPRPGR